MKWNITLVIAVAVAVVSYGLYQLSYEVQKLESDLRGLKSQISYNKEAVRVLKAEWTYKNRPEKIQELAGKYLPLLLVAPYQVAEIDDLPGGTVSASVLQTRAVPLPRIRPRSKAIASSPVSGPLHLATLKGVRQIGKAAQ